MQDYYIAASLLSADFARLGEEAQAVIDAGADMLHLDVMDNHYVPNLTVGPLVCEALRRYGIKAPIDVHLMTKPVDHLIVGFADAGASHITFHPEASEHIDRSLNLIHKHGCKAGIALNPATSLHCLEYIIDKVDLILIMSVNPGFGGQTFIPSALTKIADARKLIDRTGRAIYLGVDGGVKTENIAKIKAAGANLLIAGSAIYAADDYHHVMMKMRKEIAEVK